MSMKPYDELPWWCQLLWPWFGPPWYEQVEDLDAYLGAYWCALHLSAAELAELLADDGPPGEDYLARAARITAARHQAHEIIGHVYGPARPYQRMRTSRRNTMSPSQTWDGRWLWTATTRPGRR